MYIVIISQLAYLHLLCSDGALIGYFACVLARTATRNVIVVLLHNYILMHFVVQTPKNNVHGSI